jgi:hypothetical protein
MELKQAEVAPASILLQRKLEQKASQNKAAHQNKAQNQTFSASKEGKFKFSDQFVKNGIMWHFIASKSSVNEENYIVFKESDTEKLAVSVEMLNQLQKGLSTNHYFGSAKKKRLNKKSLLPS